ncbi:unnamed protein product [Cunninghamella blakesleeana]
MLSRLFSGIREQFGKNVSRQARPLEESSLTTYTSMKNVPNTNTIRKNTTDDFMRKDLISTSTETSSANSSLEKSNNTIIIDGRQFHNTDSIYYLPNDEEELDRLVGQHFAMKSLFDGYNFNSRVKDYVTLDHGAKILDCGCGPGTWIMDVATEYPNCQLTGLDMCDLFPTSIRPVNVNFEVGNVLKGLPYPDNTFDFINFRFFILVLRKYEWEIALKELYRVLKPGGCLESMECDQHVLGNDIFNWAGSKITELMVELDQEPYIVQKLPDIFNTLNFELLDTVKKVAVIGGNNPLGKEFLWDVVNIYRSIKHKIAPKLKINDSRTFESFLEKLQIECNESPKQTTWVFTKFLVRKPL